MNGVLFALWFVAISSFGCVGVGLPGLGSCLCFLWFWVACCWIGCLVCFVSGGVVVLAIVVLIY